MRYRSKLTLTLVALALAVSGAATAVLFMLSRGYLVREIESKAMSIAATAAVLVDADMNERIAQGTAPPDAARAIRRELARVRDANRRRDVHVHFVYTAENLPEGRLRAVVADDGPGGEDLAADDLVSPGEVGVEEMKIDPHGTWVSGYAPIRDTEGNPVGTLVVDVAAADLLGRVRLLLTGGLAAMGVALGLAVALSFPLARRVTRPLDALVAAVDRIGTGDLDARADIRTHDDFGRLADAFNAMLPRLRDHLRLRHSVQLAQEVQRNLLPTSWPRVASFEIAAKSVYCDEIGGDYYDVLDLSSGDESRLGVVVADVAGHGIAAALLMATTRAILRAHLATAESLAAAVSETNRSIVCDRFSDRFVTLFAVVADTRDLRLRWVCAGHEPAILYDPPTDTFEELGGRDIALGVSPDWAYCEHARDGWRSGQVILIGTDGIWETRDDGGNRFGRDALHDLVRKHAHLAPAEIQAAVLEALRSFRGGRSQEDDVTLVVLKA